MLIKRKTNLSVYCVISVLFIDVLVLCVWVICSAFIKGLQIFIF